MQQPAILEKPELHIVGYEIPFIHALSPDSNASTVIPPLWCRFIDDVASVSNRQGEAMYGVIYARPESERAHPDELLYVVGVAVIDGAKPPVGMVQHTITAGTFAVFTHRGPIAKIADTCWDIYRDWLPQSDYEHAGTADVELYDERVCAESDESEMEYWVPLRVKA